MHLLGNPWELYIVFVIPPVPNVGGILDLEQEFHIAEKKYFHIFSRYFRPNMWKVCGIDSGDDLLLQGHR